MLRRSGVNKIGAALRLMRFDRPVGILLLTWPTLCALWLAAKGLPPTNILLIFLAGVIVMRAAGCVINDIADRKIDGQVARTKTRPLATGDITVTAALGLFFLLAFLAFGLVLLLNRNTIYLALLGLLLAVCYPFAKRYLAIPQIVLGLAFSWPIPMAFMAVINQVPLVSWLLFAANFCWILAYDTQYALVDRQDDCRIGVHSSAVFFGNAVRYWVDGFQAVMFGLLIMIGWMLEFGLIYYCALLLVLCCMIYQGFLIRKLDPALCFRAFLNNNWLGASLFLGIVCSVS